MYNRFFKPVLTAFLLTGLISSSIKTEAQTLATYGNKTITAKEFVEAYKKNTDASVTDKKALEEYLELYINSKLKILEAYNRGFDTLPGLKEELAGLRAQVIQGYLNDPETVDKLVEEAFMRSQKDIDVSHIYIGIDRTKPDTDTLTAFNNIQEAWKELAAGKSFSDVATRYSQDPGVKNNQGHIGYITVFSLPYLFENAVYGLKAGQFSKPVRSKSGYHIFKNNAERKALGHIKAWQVLLALPPNADQSTKDKTARLADSLYNRLLAGDDKEKIAATFSNDFISAQAGGMMPTFGVGQYDPQFEKQVIGLPLNTYSKPIETTHGYHIIYKIAEEPVASSLNDPETLATLKTRVNQSDRIETVRHTIYQKVAANPGLSILPGAAQQWMLIIDSILDNRKPKIPVTISRETPFIQIGEQVFTIQNWLDYAQSHRFNPGSSIIRPYTDILHDYKIILANNYYRDHLEQFNPVFASQLNEFKDGNLFFEIMQQEIWNRAQDDSLGLKNFYNQHKENYNWKQSADAIVFYATDAGTAKELHQEISKNPTGWQQAIEKFDNKVIVDSARFEWDQLPGTRDISMQQGIVTSYALNENDNSAAFAYVVRVYPQPEPRSFSESRGFVLNDYQQYLEQQWVDALRKKYPVKINKKVLKKLGK